MRCCFIAFKIAPINLGQCTVVLVLVYRERCDVNPFAHPWKIFHSPGSNLGGGSNVTPAIKQQTHCFGGWSMENGMKMLSPPPNPLSHPTANTEKCTLLLGEGAARLSTGRKWKLHHIYRRGFVQCALKLFRFYQWRGAVPFLSDGRHRSATAKLLLFFCETAQSCPISRSFFSCLFMALFC